MSDLNAEPNVRGHACKKHYCLSRGDVRRVGESPPVALHGERHQLLGDRGWTAPRRGQDKRGRNRSAAIPPNDLSLENVSNI